MPNIPCINRIDCPCDNNPGTNYSSERPDRLKYIGLNFGWNNIPGIGRIWSRSYCFGICISDTSQQEADWCAASASVLCDPVPPIPPGCDDDPSACDGGSIYYNNAQSASSSCPDGSQSFTFTVPAGSIAAESQVIADRIALSIATNNARVDRFCATIPTAQGYSIWNCYGEEVYTGPLFVVIGRGSPFTFEITAGDLPDGISLIQLSGRTAGFYGEINSSGNYLFTLKITSSSGFVITHDYTYYAIGVTSNPLPDAQVGTQYDEQIQVAGGTPPYTFALADGSSLPDGLSLTDSGMVTGIPTTADP